MERSRTDWVYVGRSGVAAGALLRGCVTAPLDLARAALPRRVLVQRWIRYRVDLSGALPPVPPEVRLMRVTDDLVDMLRHHPEQAENQMRSGLRFWDRGLRRAYVWLGEEGPLCIQWLLTEADGARLHRLGDWAGMYPPLPGRTGQAENLFAFASARKRGVASQFEYALYHEARRLGLAQLVTHIHEANTAARAWADRTGWRRCGTITRYQVDLPGLRGRGVYVHRVEQGAGSGERYSPAPAVNAARTALAPTRDLRLCDLRPRRSLQRLANWLSRPRSYQTRHPPLLWRATMPQVEQWARTRVRTSRQVRRGAWYRVIRATALEGVLEVNRRPVTVPRPFLQILPFRPTMWSVVTRLATAQHPPASWGATYGVCPSCSARAPLGQHAVRVVCPRCNGLFQVAWEDSGLCVFEARATRGPLADEGVLPH